jgi:hypothetical protein
MGVALGVRQSQLAPDGALCNDRCGIDATVGDLKRDGIDPATTSWVNGYRRLIEVVMPRPIARRSFLSLISRTGSGSIDAKRGNPCVEIDGL